MKGVFSMHLSTNIFTMCLSKVCSRYNPEQSAGCTSCADHTRCTGHTKCAGFKQPHRWHWLHQPRWPRQSHWSHQAIKDTWKTKGL